MYSFKDLKKATGTETVQLPSVAINFNGKQLDTEIEAFQTLKVSGRETIPVELETVDVKNGSLILDERLPHRELLVTYLMSSESNTAFQNDFKALRKLLTSNEEVPITFKDEPDTVYFGRLADFETVDDDRNTVIGTFKILCSSPFKYSDAVTTTGEVTIDTFYPTQPDSITLTIGTTTNNITINHNGYTISASTPAVPKGKELQRYQGHPNGEDWKVMQVGDKVTIREGATRWLNSNFKQMSPMEKDYTGKTDTIEEVADVKIGYSNKAYYLGKMMVWVLEQDLVEPRQGFYTVTDTFNAGLEVVLKFDKEDMTMTVNGVDATYMIDLNSDFENFELEQGQSVTSEQGTISLVARERWL